MLSRGAFRLASSRTRRAFALSWSALFILSLLLQYATFALAPATLAVHNDGLFELDKNAVTTTTHDWNQVFADVKNGTTTSGSDHVIFKTDAINSTADEHLFTGGSTKDGIDISSWKWTSGPGVQDKNDIEHAYAAAYTNADNHQIVYFGQDRYAQNGDAFVGFWFLQGSVGENANHTFSGVHQDGDILVQVNFTNGGTISTFLVSKWSTASGGLVGVANGVDCSAASTPANDPVCGVVNASEITSPWPYTPKSGTANKIPAGGFFEAGIDLTHFGLDQGCFSTFISETRSSQPLTSTLSDYAMGGFSFCEPPTIATQVKHDGQSLGSVGTITIGDSVTDTATLTGSKGTVTGSVEFSSCFNASAVPDCSTAGSGTSRGTKTLSGGTATSNPFTPTAVGFYCFRVDYTAAQGSKYLDASHTNATTECFQVLKKPTAITTSAAQTVTVGTAIADSATLSGATADAGGTITFKAYGPDDATCSGAADFTSAPFAVSGNDTYGPASYSPKTAGTYRWIASYSGDAKNLSSTGVCNDEGETDTVNKANPGISTVASADVTIGGSISDTATVSGGNSPTGTVTFKLYGPNDATCANTAIFTSANRPLNGATATSAAFTPTAVGTYRWVATYNGDVNNNTASGACNDENESVVVNPAHPSINTELASGNATGTTISIALGASAHDTSTLTNSTATAGGTVHYQVFSDANCQTLFKDAGTKTVTNHLAPNSDDVQFNASGNYYWQADYSGDAANDPASSDCSLEIVSVGLNQPTISTNASASVVIGGQIHDTATLAGGFSPTGTITFRLYGPDDTTCATVISTSTKAVNGNGDYVSAAVTANVAGTYRWIATYSGDANNAAVAGTCNDANESVIVTTPHLHAIKLVATGDGTFGPTSVAKPGDVLNFEITVSNTGNGAATNVPVSDNIAPLLAHASYNADCSNSCGFAANTLTWTIPTIAAGGSVTLTFSVTLDASFPTGTTHLPNVVVVTGPGSNCAAGSEDANCDTDTTVATSVLTISKSFTGNTNGTDPDLHVPAAKVGDTLHYTLAYAGAGPLTNGVITDVLPQGLDYVVGSAAGDANFTFDSYNATTRTLTWKAATLPDPANGTVTYNVKVLATAPDFAQPLTNLATIDSDQTAPDSDTADVAVLAPPEALTPPPTSTITPSTQTSNPGFALMLILLGVAALTLIIGFVTPAPARATRRRDRLG